eukprot:Opistho-1_new@82656
MANALSARAFLAAAAIALVLWVTPMGAMARPWGDASSSVVASAMARHSATVCPHAMSTNCSSIIDEGNCEAHFHLPQFPTGADVARCKSVGGEYCAPGNPCHFAACPAMYVDACESLTTFESCAVAYQRYPSDAAAGQFLACAWHEPVDDDRDETARCKMSSAPFEWCTPAEADDSVFF